MTFKTIILLAVLLSVSSAFADFETLTVTSKRAANGSQELCVKPFPALKTTKPDCILVSKVTNQALASNDSDVEFTELNLEAVGVDKQNRFAAIIEWKGKGAGVLAISGPKGRLFAIGSVSPPTSDQAHSTVAIEQFSDESLSQQFDRAVVFGESDTLRLHAKTKVWLEGVLGPAIDEFLKAPELAPR